MGIPLYRQWGQLAFGPYLAAALLMARGGLAGGDRRHRGRGWRAARVVAFLIVLFGATVVPLTLEVVWRSEGNPSLHVQPEVVVVEQAGVRAAHGKDPYRVIDRDGHILIHEKTEPIYELYYPYLPGMVHLRPLEHRRRSKIGARLTDARIQFLVFTVLVTLFALSRLRPPTDARFRSLQVLTVLPTAALPLATGGDDMPVAALMLLGLVALQRRRPVLAGLALGAASSLKFTAWPLALLALWAASDLHRRRAVGRYVLGVAAVMVPVVAAGGPREHVRLRRQRDPLPAGPGRCVVTGGQRPPRPHPGVGLPAGAPALRGGGGPGRGARCWSATCWRQPPRNAAGVAALTGWVMLIAILLAPATRVGYLLYPINLFVWAWMLSQADDPVGADAAERSSTGRLGRAVRATGRMPVRCRRTARTPRRRTGSCRPTCRRGHHHPASQ